MEKAAVMTYEEILRMGREVWNDENFGLEDWEIEHRKREDDQNIRIGLRLQNDPTAYARGVERNKELLKYWEGSPSYRWAYEAWQEIIENGGYERVLEMHLNPRPHQQLLSSNPFCFS